MWNCTINLDICSHILFGESVDDIFPSELKELKGFFKDKVLSGVKGSLKRLQDSGHRVYITKTSVDIKDIRPETLMEVTDLVLSWTGELGEIYLDDLQQMIPLDDILTYLRNNDSELMDKFNRFLEENIWE